LGLDPDIRSPTVVDYLDLTVCSVVLAVYTLKNEDTAFRKPRLEGDDCLFLYGVTAVTAR